MQARLRSLQHALDRHDTIFAKDILLSTPWKISTMPELALLAFSALEVGDRLLESEQSADAVRCYRFIPPKDTLVILQKQRLNELQSRFKERSGAVSVTGGSVWTHFYRQLIDRIEKQLNELRAADDYTPGYLLRLGQAMLLDKRIEEAWIVFQELAKDDSIPEDIRSNAHYRWILAAQELTDWDRSIELARSFIDSYPESPLGPQTLSLIAQALQERQKFDEAVGVLNDLLREFPVPRRFQWYIAEGMLSLPTAKWSMVISFFSGVMASGFAFGCAKDTVEFFNAGIGEVRFPVGEGFLLVIFDYVGPWV